MNLLNSSFSFSEMPEFLNYSKNSKDQILDQIDSNDFRQALLNRFGVKDDLELAPVIRPLLTDFDSLLQLSSEFNLHPKEFVARMALANMEALNDRKTASKLKAFFKRYDYHLRINGYAIQD